MRVRISLLLLLFALHAKSCYGVLPFKEVYRFTSSMPSPSGLIWGDGAALYGSCYRGGDHNLGFVFRVTTNGSLVALASFEGTNGAHPSGKLVLGNDGLLYGTTAKGGPADKGTIFRVSTNGVLQMLAAFTGTSGPNFGAQPSGLCLGSDGAFYGCTSLGANGLNSGTAFRMTSDGNLTSLVTFSSSEHGFVINGTLVEGPDGAFYGTAQSAGPAGYGTVFRLTAGGVVSIVAAFNGTNGAQPMAPVTVGADGVLYGTTYSGGQDFNGIHGGTVFRCTIGGDLSTLHDFVIGTSGSYPRSGLVQDTNGILYGTTSVTGSADTFGTLFSISTNGNWTNLMLFRLTNGIAFSESPVIASDGSFYGTTPGGGAGKAGMVFKLSPGNDLIPLSYFRCGSNGVSPSSLLQTNGGLLFGTTTGGGTNNVGTVFCMDTNGALFFSTSLDPGIGSVPSSPLIKGADDYLYGLAQEGGDYGHGSIYRITTNGVLSAVASFNKTNGSAPTGPFYIDANRNIFGLTYKGGTNDQGALFRVDPNGAISCLFSFNINQFGANAGFPRYGLIRASDGAFYGTSGFGGNNLFEGCVFRLTTSGALTIAGSFTSSTGDPESTLIESNDGFIYGATRKCFFRVTTNGGFSVITTFSSPWPRGPLTVGPDGAFYGEATSSGSGEIFRITTNGPIKSLMSFNSSTTGASAVGGLILGHDNRLYGTTTFAQTFAGNVFSVDLSAKLNTPVRQSNSIVLSFSGMPRVPYQIQRSSTPGGPWSNLAIVTLDGIGNGKYTNSAAPPTNAFYRLKVN
jgi:uncharacterized repeat protein (TIGR03803 family)